MRCSWQRSRRSGVRIPWFAVAAATVGALLTCAAASAQVTIDFETNPALPAQPDNFAAAGAMQTYTSPGVYTISGGVVLGNPTFLAAFPGIAGSAPNLYGTTDIADPSLLDTLTLDLPAAENVDSLSFVLFNGQPIAEDYSIAVFSGATTLSSLTITGLPDASSINSAITISLSNSPVPITQLTVTTPNATVNGWDFFVDSLTLTIGPQAPPPVPEPSAGALAAACVLPLGCLLRRRRRVR